MRIAVTGIAGIIGKVLGDAFKDKGFEVVGIDRAEPVSQAPESLHKIDKERVDVVCDLGRPLDELAVKNPFEDCDVVVHLAGGPVFVFSPLIN
jgi:nucleoside-diphosphate-sugar epimerase